MKYEGNGEEDKEKVTPAEIMMPIYAVQGHFLHEILSMLISFLGPQRIFYKKWYVETKPKVHLYRLDARSFLPVCNG